MSLRYEFAQRVAVSMVGALFFTMVPISSAPSLVPVACPGRRPARGQMTG